MHGVPRWELLQWPGVHKADPLPPWVLLGHPGGGPDVQGVPQGHVPSEPWGNVVLLVVSVEWLCLLDGMGCLKPFGLTLLDLCHQLLGLL